MKLDLSQIFDKDIYKLDLDESLDIKTSDKNFETKSDIRLDNPVKITGSIYATEDEGELYLDAKLTYKYVESCGRCLTEFSPEVENDLSAKIIRNSNGQTEEDDDELIIYYESKNSELEIEEAILATVELNRPMKPLCSEDCKGLCDVCGVDLNLEQCDCTKQDIDPRLEKLRDLLD